jgi:hypothetical protein
VCGTVDVKVCLFQCDTYCPPSDLSLDLALGRAKATMRDG